MVYVTARDAGHCAAVESGTALAASLAVMNAVAIPLGMGWAAQAVAAVLSGLVLLAIRKVILRPLRFRLPVKDATGKALRASYQRLAAGARDTSYPPIRPLHPGDDQR